MGNFEHQPVQTIDPATAAQQLAPTGELSREFMDARQGLWVKRDGRPVWLGCGDEGYPTPVSIATFAQHRPDAMPLNEGYVSNFGQLAGLAKNIATTKEMTDPGFFARMGGMPGMLDYVMRMAAVTQGRWQVLPATHSARPQEMAAHEAHYKDAERAAAFGGIVLPKITEVNFLAKGNSDTGCAANMNEGLASSALGMRGDDNKFADGNTLYDIAGKELTHDFGSDMIVEQALDAHINIGEQMRTPDGEYVFDRKQTRTLRELYGLQTMVLQRDGPAPDKHLAASQTGLMLNLDPRSVRNARGAAEAGLGFYAVDLGAMALWANQLMSEHGGIDPLRFMIVSAAETVPIRSVLASHDSSDNNNPDPRRVRVGVRPGMEPGEAVELISKLSRDRYTKS